MKTMSVKIAELVKDGLQVRVRMNNDTVELYAQVMADSETDQSLPPVVVFRDTANGLLYLADGFHRVAAAERIGRTEIEAEVREGTFNDALKYALCANSTNGLQRTNDDIRHAMELAIEYWNTIYVTEPRTTEDGLPSKRQLIRICGATDHAALNFLKLQRVVDSTTPPAKNDKMPPDVDRAHDLTRGNRMHTDERNPSKKKLLKEGRDQFGVVIPERLLAAFRSSRPKECQQKISEARMAVKEALKSGDPAFAGIGPRVFVDLDNAMHQIAYGKPFCVCRGCRGEGCDFCLSRGFQTQLQYRNLPSEFMHHGQ